jgi:hypothetical protein
LFNGYRVEQSSRRPSALTAKRPQQLDDLLRVTPRLAGVGTEAEPVQFLLELQVRFALSPQFDGLRDRFDVLGPQRLRDQSFLVARQ